MKIHPMFEYSSKKHILLLSALLLFAYAIAVLFIDVLKYFISPLISLIIFKKMPEELVYVYDDVSQIIFRLGVFIRDLFSYLTVLLLVVYGYYRFKKLQEEKEHKLIQKIKPTFRDGINLEIRDYLKYLPLIKDALKKLIHDYREGLNKFSN